MAQRNNKENVWTHLDSIQNPHLGPWLCIGDFNDLHDQLEKYGGRPVLNNHNQGLRSFLNSNGLIDIGFSNPKFTWRNNRHGRALIRERIDRIIVNQQWRLLFPDASLNHLASSASDHHPLLLQTTGSQRKPTRRRNAIESIKLGLGIWSMDPFAIANIFIDHFKVIYTSINPYIPNQLENLFEKQISDQKNERLLVIPSEVEILEAIKQILNYKAPGPDGMTALFYRHYWSIIKNEVIEAVQNFFRSGKLLKQLNHTNIALIPKTQSPNSPTQYHPISLTNVFYKIITKMLSNHFKATLLKIIDECAKVHSKYPMIGLKC
ncbi:hypothetical protein I3760_04G137100 [Carya illinoinensis]|nr:hypothetical protein I3760_04G137100 [Carya illinoinensis]